jgi:hypothetical protein
MSEPKEVEEKESIYKILSEKDVNEFVEKKGKFSYLSWSDAVDALLSAYPTASWSIREWDDLPYLKTEAGYFVSVTVTIEGIDRTQLHPVLGHNNKPISKPDCFQINTSIQRALTKAMSLHGLGLYIYRGEDLPPEDKSTLIDYLIELLKDNSVYKEEYRNNIKGLTLDVLKTKIAEQEAIKEKK